MMQHKVIKIQYFSMFSELLDNALRTRASRGDRKVIFGDSMTRRRALGAVRNFLLGVRKLHLENERKKVEDYLGFWVGTS